MSLVRGEWKSAALMYCNPDWRKADSHMYLQGKSVALIAQNLYQLRLSFPDFI